MEFGLIQQPTRSDAVKQPERRNFTLIAVSCCGVLFLLFLIIKTETLNNNSNSNLSLSTISSSASVSSPSTSEKIIFSLKRQGYDELDYFSKVSSESTYVFLESYDAVLEPSAPMVLHVYADSKSTTT